MYKRFIGIDNGVTGTMGIINGVVGDVFFKIPVISQQNYTKAKNIITRIDVGKLWQILSNNLIDYQSCFCLIERPMVNPTRHKATLSAIRALEATLTVLEMMGIPYGYIDSKEWQRSLLPKGVSGDDLKSASRDIGTRFFPQFSEEIHKHKDADGILIALYAKQKYK